MSGTLATPIMREVRAELVRAAIAHQRRAEEAIAALPTDRDAEAPPWLYDALRGSSMASLYAQILATVLAEVEREVPTEAAGDIRASVLLMLENGAEDENADVRPEGEAS